MDPGTGVVNAGITDAVEGALSGISIASAFESMIDFVTAQYAVVIPAGLSLLVLFTAPHIIIRMFRSFAH
jgi:hypothetical protein